MSNRSEVEASCIQDLRSKILLAAPIKKDAHYSSEILQNEIWRSLSLSWLLIDVMEMDGDIDASAALQKNEAPRI